MIFQMPELHYTSKDDGHIHIAMLNDDLTGVAIGPNHNHIITFDDAVKNFRIVETDGHTHTLNGVVEFKASKLKSESDDDEMRTMMNLYRLALEHECESKERAKEARDFVNNKQWGGDEVRSEWNEAIATQREEDIQRSMVAAGNLSEDRKKRRVIIEERTVYVDREIEKLVDSGVCFKPDGVRCINASVIGEIAAGCKPDGTLPATKPAG